MHVSTAAYVRVRGQPCGVSSHHCIGSEDGTLATRLQGKCLYTVIHLASPRHVFLNIVEYSESWSRNSDNEHFTVLGAVQKSSAPCYIRN